MSTDLRLFIIGSMTLDELVEALQPRLPEPFDRQREHNGTDYWATSWNNHFTCVSRNSFVYDCEGEAEDYERYEFVLTFYNLNIECHGTNDDYIAARDAWIESTWQHWLTWLRAVGVTDVLMNRDFGWTLRRWCVDETCT